MGERTKLIQARIQKCWTQEQAAGLAGVSVRAWRDWERGIVTPRLSSIQQLCVLFECSAEDLDLSLAEVASDVSETARYPLALSSDLTMQLLTVAFVPQRRFEAVQTEIATILERYDTNEGDPMNRREALLRLLSLPFIASLRPGITRRDEDVITQCAAGIAACWEFSKSEKDEDLVRAFTMSGAYVDVFKEIVQDSSSYRKTVASLIGYCSLLRAILGWHLESLDCAAMYGKDALLYSKMAENIPLQIAVHTQLSWIYYYNRQSKKTLQEIEEAAYLLETSNVPLAPRLHSSVQSTLAIRQAMHGQSQRAIHSLKQAHQEFYKSPKPGEDIAFAYVDYDQPSLILEDGMTYVNLGRYDTALDSFMQVVDTETLKPKMPIAERVRTEVLNNQTIASLKIKGKDLERSVHLWKAAIQGAKSLKSEQRYSEAIRAYDIMEALWSDDKRIQELRDLVVHW